MSAWASDGSQNGRLITIRTDGTDFRDVYGPFIGGGWPDTLRWTPDGVVCEKSAGVGYAASR